MIGKSIFGAFLMAAAVAQAIYSPRMAGVYGDARFGREASATSLTNVEFNVSLPYGEWDGMTVCGWMRLPGIIITYGLITTLYYTPEKINYFNPDLASNAFGHVSETNLSGSISIASFPWKPYAPGSNSNVWPKGVYTLAGWSSNVVTVTLGGTDVTLGPGAFNRNAIPGPADSVILSGTGAVSIGISQCPCMEFFGGFAGINNTTEIQPDNIVTSELSFISYRIKLNSESHYYRTEVTRMGGSTTGITKTNAMPRTARALSWGGIYKVGLNAVTKTNSYTVEWFNLRAYPRYLTDAELSIIRQNGEEEIGRRAIPKWK
jgi:hypothetical protein